MKVQLKPGEPVKFKGKVVVATEGKPVILSGEEDALAPLVAAGIATEVKEAATKPPAK